MKSVACFVVLTSVVSGVVLLPEETMIHHGLRVSPESGRSYESTSPSFGYVPQSLKSGQSLVPMYSPASGGNGKTKYGEAPLQPYPTTHKILSMEHDIKHQLASLERKIMAARPYFSDHPQILHEAEEQLRTLQHIHAGKLLRGISSIRQLELQQEILIHKVNAQLEDSVRQLKHTSVLQHAISEKQKSAPNTHLPESSMEASKQLTAHLHAIDETRIEDIALGIANEDINHDIAKEVVDHDSVEGIAEHQITRGIPTNPPKIDAHQTETRDQQIVFPITDHDEVRQDAVLDPRISVNLGVHSSKLSVEESVPGESSDGHHNIDRIDSDVIHSKQMDKSMESELDKSSQSS